MTEQPYRPATLWPRVFLLGALGIFVIVVEMRTVVNLAGVAGGLIIGLALGGYSLTHTEFHTNPPRYKTNPYVGALVATLFAVRLLYDAAMAHAQLGHQGAVNPIGASWISALLYFLFVAYWEVFYLGVIRRLKGQSGPHQSAS
ncbi:hypothetical protein [Sulfobacillus harzensis]|uniref:Uncharacterized protein n=1 Tax=Sulfobacillus harzensis TaxID=2729629 RepID=A0A7Y0Q0Q5_9FIRM|nr:hypothetical protein [Sulfobacillus harzensis]NMP21288.1 hypothetical protein [Sulfobacillus harzensis]